MSSVSVPPWNSNATCDRARRPLGARARPRRSGAERRRGSRRPRCARAARRARARSRAPASKCRGSANRSRRRRPAGPAASVAARADAAASRSPGATCTSPPHSMLSSPAPRRPPRPRRRSPARAASPSKTGASRREYIGALGKRIPAAADRDERRHRPDGLPPAPGPLDPGDPRRGRRRARRRHPGHASSRSWSAATRPSCAETRRAARARRAGPPTSTRRSPTRRRDLLRRPGHLGARKPRSPPRSRPASTSTPRSRSPRRSTRPLELARLAEPPGVKNGVVQDKLFLPGPAQAAAPGRRRLLRPDPVGARRVRLLGLRGRLAGGAAAVAGTTAPRTAAASSSTCSRHWSYVLENLFGPVAGGHGPGRHPHPRARGTSRAAVPGHRRRRRVRHLRAGGRRSSPRSTPPGRVRVYRDELVEFQVDGTEGSAVAGLRECRVQHRATTPKPVWNPDLPATERVPRPVAGGAGQRRVRQRLQGPVGEVPAPRGRGRARSPTTSLAGARGRAARRAGPAVLGRGPPHRACRSSRCEARCDRR